jgi:hypothetical protein
MLYKKHSGVCSICNIKTEIQKSGSTSSNPNTATVGHIYDKHDLRRFCIGGNSFQLECFKCNNDKDRMMKKERTDFYNSILIESYDAPGTNNSL